MVQCILIYMKRFLCCVAHLNFGNSTHTFFHINQFMFKKCPSWGQSLNTYLCFRNTHKISNAFRLKREKNLLSCANKFLNIYSLIKGQFLKIRYAWDIASMCVHKQMWGVCVCAYILYIYVEHSPTKAIYMKKYMG